jgi:cobalamin 5'-phosphate synthase/cobalamin synthase
MRPLLSAIALLTRIPTPTFAHSDEASLRKSWAWFPVIGFLLGTIYAATAWLLHWVLPGHIIAVILLIEDALLTGALHLDGLADMADGFGGGRSKDDVLRIMRDHVIGSYGGGALVLALLLKTACLSELLQTGDETWFLFVVPSLARWAIVLLSVAEPYARESVSGSGALAQSVTRSHLLIASAFCVVLAVVFGWRRCLACWLAVSVSTLVMARICRRKIGGITGDTLGANVIVCECVQMAVAVAVGKLGAYPLPDKLL